MVLALLLIVPSILAANAFAEALPYTGPVILSFGSDEPIDYTIKQIQSFIPTAPIFSVSNVAQLHRVLQKTAGYPIYVGHGQETGLMVGASLITWNDLATLISDSPSPTHMLAACYSASAQVQGKFVFGFKNLVDVDEAAMWVTILYHGIQGQLDEIPGILKYFTEILNDKVLHPERNMSAFLGYYYQSVRGIWHVKWNDQYGYYVKYTHADTYSHYTWIGVESTTGLSGNNLATGHIPKSFVDTYDIAAMVSTGLSGVGVGAFLGGIVGFIVGAIVFLAGVAAAVFVETFIRDELGAGWLWMQNWWASWYGGGSDFKLGSFMWMRCGISFGFPFCYPLWYGGRALGIDGV